MTNTADSSSNLAPNKATKIIITRTTTRTTAEVATAPETRVRDSSELGVPLAHLKPTLTKNYKTSIKTNLISTSTNLSNSKLVKTMMEITILKTLMPIPKIKKLKTPSQFVMKTLKVKLKSLWQEIRNKVHHRALLLVSSTPSLTLHR